MQPGFSLSPRYALDDESSWWVGIDPLRRYWLKINSDSDCTVAIPGLSVASQEAFIESILLFRDLLPGNTLELPTFSDQPLRIRCIHRNSYAIKDVVAGVPVWHLFERETLEQMLMTAHPDWQCSSGDVELGRRMIAHSWQTANAA